MAERTPSTTWQRFLFNGHTHYVFEHSVDALPRTKCEKVLKQLQYFRDNNLYYKAGDQHAEIAAITSMIEYLEENLDSESFDPCVFLQSITVPIPVEDI